MNGSNGSLPPREQPTERTALLRDRTTGTPPGTVPNNRLASVGPLVAHLQTQQPPLLPHCSWDSNVPVSQAVKCAYTLVVLLQFSCVPPSHRISARDFFEQWSTEQSDASVLRAVGEEISTVWADLIYQSASSDKLEEVLWLEFPLEDDGTAVVRGGQILPQGRT